jgi:hypothetical protein
VSITLITCEDIVNIYISKIQGMFTNVWDLRKIQEMFTNVWDLRKIQGMLNLPL